MQYVEVRAVCKGCRLLAPLAVFFVYSHAERFPGEAQVNERQPNRGIIERQMRAAKDGSEYLRYKFQCRCGSSPVVRQDAIDRALEDAYEHLVVAKVIYLSV